MTPVSLGGLSIKSVGRVILFLDTMNVIDIKLCMEVLFIEFLPVHITFFDLDLLQTCPNSFN